MKIKLLLSLMCLGFVGSIYSDDTLNELLIQSIKNGDRERVKLALKEGAEIDYRGMDGKTAIEVAKEKKNKRIIRMLNNAKFKRK